MAKFTFELPDDLMKDIKFINENADNIFEQMTRAGAEKVQENIKHNVPSTWKNSDIMNALKVTKSYKTKDGVATAVKFYGYFINEKGVKTPAPLVANVTEYGSSKVKKKPFLRKSFNEVEITQAMLDKQTEVSGGLLDG